MKCGDAASGRKMYYNVQRYATDPHECIGRDGAATGAGHLRPSLQVLDDAGRFRGLLTVEATVYSRQRGAAVMGIYDLVDAALAA